MYLEYFGLSEPPFRITPHTDFFFDGANRGATLDALIYAITHDEGIVKVSGEVGSGKTMLCRVLMERLPQNVTSIYLANPSLSREDILYAISDELQLHVPERTRLSAVLKALHDHLIREFSRGRQVVVLIDEAHAMPAESLEEIRLLSNLESNRSKLLQLVLFGQPEINDTLARADMRQLKERITHNFLLEPLVRDDIAHYLDFRLRAAGYRGPDLFSPQAVKLIAKVSQGLTRRINILADKALLSAFSAGVHQVGLREARRAAADSDFSNATYVRPHRPSRTAILVAIAAGTITAMGIVAWFLLSPANLDIQDELPRAKEATSSRQALTPASTSGPASVSSAPHREASGNIGGTEPTQAAAEVSSQSAPRTSRQQTGGAEASGAGNLPGTVPTTSATLPMKLGARTQKAMDAGTEWLSRASDDQWFVQLYTGDGRDPSGVEDALRRIANSRVDMMLVRAYRSDLSGTPRFGVVFGEFKSRLEALETIRGFPKVLTTLQPYPRQVIKLR